MPDFLEKVATMTSVERLISLQATKVDVVSPDDDAVTWCFDQYFAELATRFEGGFDRARYLAAAPNSELSPPSGYAFVATLDGAPVGCGSLKVHDGGVGEIKRIWTAPHARGRGVARRLMLEIERVSASLGLSKLRLGTNKALAEAKSMYERLGYVDVQAFDDDPFTHYWFEKDIG